MIPYKYDEYLIFKTAFIFNPWEPWSTLHTYLMVDSTRRCCSAFSIPICIQESVRYLVQRLTDQTVGFHDFLHTIQPIGEYLKYATTLPYTSL